MLSLARAVIQMSCLLSGATTAGLGGALVGLGVSALAVYPFVIWLARRHSVWDPVHDLVFAAFGGTVGGLALWLNWPAILGLF